MKLFLMASFQEGQANLLDMALNRQRQRCSLARYLLAKTLLLVSPSQKPSLFNNSTLEDRSKLLLSTNLQTYLVPLRKYVPKHAPINHHLCQVIPKLSIMLSRLQLTTALRLGITTLQYSMTAFQCLSRM